jgi:hypothetical protein
LPFSGARPTVSTNQEVDMLTGAVIGVTVALIWMGIQKLTGKK